MRVIAMDEARHSSDSPAEGTDDEKVWLTMNSTTVSAELGLRLVVPDRSTVPLLAGLSYTADDPYAIRMAFHVGNDEPVEWIFARELLTVGIVRRVGDGDVQVWPARADGERTLHISLTSPFGQALFEVPLAPLTEFLHRTYELVPAGRETDFMNLDSELSNMLWSS
ncbi:sporulation-specific cell division protein SsgB [Planomonospora parontospora subsp. parontospora]|nr:sporulation-specific cell division protein SsgB [Planomonospora parontospora subsp. parontospora]